MFSTIMTCLLMWDRRELNWFEKTYHQRSIVESVFSSLKCGFTARLFAQRSWQHKDCSCSLGASTTTCCHSGTTQKTRVVCLAYAVQSWNVLVQDAPHRPATGKFQHMQEIKSDKCR